MGTATAGLFALCESSFRPNLSASQLVTVVEKCFQSAIKRDISSGCDLTIYTLCNDSIYCKEIESIDV
jgi:20S proteasome alpha/beta subunit